MGKAYTITPQHHEKKNVTIYVVRLNEKVDRGIFTELKAVSKSYHGYYSSFSGVNGFVFSTEEDAKAFGEDITTFIYVNENQVSNDEDVMQDEDDEIQAGPKSQMPLHEALKYLIKREGADILKNPRIVNMLDDYQAYDAIPCAKYIIRSMIADRYMYNFVQIGSWNKKSIDFISMVSSETGFVSEYLLSIFSSIAFALGWFAEWQSISTPILVRPSSKPVKKWSHNMSEDKADAFFKSITEYDNLSAGKGYVTVRNIFFFFNECDRLTLSCEITKTKKTKDTLPTLRIIVYDLKGRIRLNQQVTYFRDEKIGTEEIVLPIFDIDPEIIGKIKLKWECYS